jgi:hypothetical protein
VYRPAESGAVPVLSSASDMALVPRHKGSLDGAVGDRKCREAGYETCGTSLDEYAQRTRVRWPLVAVGT